MNYMSIEKETISDGPGFRVSVYVSGCRNHCKGCHNPTSWDFDAGSELTLEHFEDIRQQLSKVYISGLSVLGGEPLDPRNQSDVLKLLQHIESVPNRDVWIYTGYEWEDLMSGGRANTEFTSKILEHTNVMVVGPFILEQRDISDNNRWRGSRNQRVVDVKKSLESEKKIYLNNIPNNE